MLYFCVTHVAAVEMPNLNKPTVGPEMQILVKLKYIDKKCSPDIVWGLIWKLWSRGIQFYQKKIFLHSSGGSGSKFPYLGIFGRNHENKHFLGLWDKKCSPDIVWGLIWKPWSRGIQFYQKCFFSHTSRGSGSEFSYLGIFGQNHENKHFLGLWDKKCSHLRFTSCS